MGHDSYGVDIGVGVGMCLLENKTGTCGGRNGWRDELAGCVKQLKKVLADTVDQAHPLSRMGPNPESG